MDINFLVKREVFTDKRTLGKMYVNGEYICDTLEDKDRKLETAGASAKVYSQTAIPRGKYRMTYHFWPKFGNWFPLLQNVPCFQGILIHGGSNEGHSKGCILVGTRTGSDTLANSSAAMEKIRKVFTQNKGADFWITVE